MSGASIPWRARHLVIAIALACAGASLAAWPAHAQPPQRPESAAAEAAAGRAETTAPPATLAYTNRPIVRFRASVLSRTPHDRADAAVSVLDRMVDEVPRGRFATGEMEGGVRVVSLEGRPVFVIMPQDVDELAGENLDTTAAEAVRHVQIAFDEAVELRTPARLLRAGLLALGATVLFLAGLWVVRRGHRASATRVTQRALQQIERMRVGEIISRASRARDMVRNILAMLWLVLALFITYSWLTFVLRRFPYTRPWGESLRSSLLGAFASVGRATVDALPGLFTVLIIMVGARFLSRLVALFFEAVAQERVKISGFYPETAPQTRRIVNALIWLFALIVSYKYLPGSDSDVFKGVSVFVGLMVSLGSSGIMNQVMSGLTITYSRALRMGDFVKVGDLEGTVTHIGPLATKIKTSRREEITIPNAVVVSNATINYSKNAAAEGVYVPASLTIGYDVPWRQVRALLLLAAGRTEGIRQQPAPDVRQTALEDFYVHYTLLVCVEQPNLRSAVLDRLHANIQDAFNEHGVQIMSPHYESDPGGAKIVPPARWYPAPAVAEARLAASGSEPEIT